MGTIWNLTQHLATQEQKAGGVVDLPERLRKKVIELLTFDSLPERAELHERAAKIVMVAKEVCRENQLVMIGGAPFFMSTLEAFLTGVGVPFVYSFSWRIEKHEGFI